MSIMGIKHFLITPRNMVVTAKFTCIYSPFINDLHLIMIVEAHNPALALITPGAIANTYRIVRLKLIRAGLNLCSRHFLRIHDE